MDRILLKFALFTIIYVGWAAEAGVEMTPRAEIEDPQPREYPVSKFGQPPPPMPSHDRPSFRLQEDQPSGGLTAASVESSAEQESEGRSPAGMKMLKGQGMTQDQEDVHAKNVDRKKSFVGKNSTLARLIPDSKKGVQEVALIAGDLGFFPKTVFVNRDIPVRMFVTGASRNTLCIMLDKFKVHKQVNNGHIEEINLMPKIPGRYRFYCPINGMEGTMVVRDMVSKRGE